MKFNSNLIPINNKMESDSLIFPLNTELKIEGVFLYDPNFETDDDILASVNLSFSVRASLFDSYVYNVMNITLYDVKKSDPTLYNKIICNNVFIERLKNFVTTSSNITRSDIKKMYKNFLNILPDDVRLLYEI